MARNREMEKTDQAISKTTGREVPILKKENDKYVMDQDILESILCHESIGNRPVSIVAVAGPFRKGKSFLLNLFLRYLRNRGFENGDWIGHLDEPLEEGFEWRGGSDGVTSGITMWNEPFIIKQGGNEIAVILMDTQGAFANESDFSECVRIFTTTFLVSSLFIYNLNGLIQNDNLQYLEYFMNYTKELKKNDEKKILQSILGFQKKKKKGLQQTFMFLIRDWASPHQSSYGVKGGQEYLEKEISKTKKVSSLNCSKLKKTFGDELLCYLLPFPGEKVQVSENDTLYLRDVHPSFISQVSDLATFIFHPESKILQKSKVGGRSLLNIIFNTWNIFEELPQPDTICRLASKNFVMANQFLAENQYNEVLDKVLVEDGITMEDFLKQSTEAKTAALISFRKQISESNAEDQQNGVRTLQTKFEQLHKRCILLYKIKLMKTQNKKENFRKEFEKEYINQIETIMISNDQSSDRIDDLNNLHENYKEVTKIRFQILPVEEKELILNGMEKCFEVFRKRIQLKKKFKQNSEAEDILEIICIHLQEAYQLTEETKDSTISNLSVDKRKHFSNRLSEFTATHSQSESCVEDEIKEGIMKACEDYHTFIPKLLLKTKMVIFEDETMKNLHKMLTEMKDVYFESKHLESAFSDIRWKYLREYVEKARTFGLEVDVKVPIRFIESFIVPELDLARRINDKNKKYVNWSFKMDLLRAKLEYTELMHKKIDSAYVDPEVLEAIHKQLVIYLCEYWKTTKGKDCDALGSIEKHVEIIENNLDDLYKEFKEWNEVNKTFYNRVATGITGLFAGAGGAAGAGTAFAIIAAEISLTTTATIISAAGGGAAVLVGISVGAIAYCATNAYYRKKQKQCLNDNKTMIKADLQR